MSPTQQWPPATPPPVVFSPPEPEPAPERTPARKPAGAATSRPFGDLTDDELAEAHTEARRVKAQLAAEARRRAGKPLGRTGPDRQPQQPRRDRGKVIKAAREMIAKGEAVSVSGVMKSQRCGYTVAVQAMAVLEAEGLVERGGDGKWHVR